MCPVISHSKFIQISSLFFSICPLRCFCLPCMDTKDHQSWCQHGFQLENLYFFAEMKAIITWKLDLKCFVSLSLLLFLFNWNQAKREANPNTSPCQRLHRDWPQVSLIQYAMQLCGFDNANIISVSSARFYILNQWEAEAIASFLYLMKLFIIWDCDPGNIQCICFQVQILWWQMGLL